MTKTKFWNTPYPYNDFLVFSCNENTISEDQKGDIQIQLKKLGITHLIEKKYGRNLCFSAVTHAPEECTAILSGVAQQDGRFYFGQDTIKEDSVKLDDSIGIFTLLNITNESVHLTQDFMGCGTLFYAEMKGSFVVSNRYHLLLLFLSWIGYKGKLNPAKVISTVYSNTTFLSQNISSQMDIEGVFQLPHEKEIRIDQYGWRIADKASVKEAFLGCPQSERKRLIQKGKEEIIENITAVMNSEQFTKIITDISGGYDSRAVFAALLNIEDSIQKVEIYSKDIPGSPDLTIASGLKNLFGGKYYEDSGRKQYPLTVTENLHIWRSYYMGTYYKMGLGAWSPKGENVNQIRLSGGCGELYRTFWSKIYHKQVGNAESAPELSSRLVDSFTLLSAPNEKNKTILKELITTEIEKIQGVNSIEKFDYHYLHFRNRYHFGMRAFEYFHDCPMWFPIMSKSIFTASRSMSLEDKQKEKLMLELTEQLHPLLVWIDYGDVPAEQNEGLCNLELSDVRFKNIKINLDSNIDDWKEMNTRNKEMAVKYRPKMPNEFYNEWRDHREVMKEELRSVFNKLKGYSSEMNEIFDNHMLRFIEKNQSNDRIINEMYAKLCSLHDQIEIFT